MEQEREARPKLVQELALNGGDPPSRYILRTEDRPIRTTNAPAPIPIIDLSRLSQSDGGDEAAKLRSALESWGLFLAIGHGISPAFLDEVWNVSREFFHLPIEEKHKYTNLVNGNEFRFEGYGNDRVITNEQILNWHDRLYLVVEPESQRNLSLWPEFPNNFRNVLHDYTTENKKIFDQVQRILAKVLGLSEDYFVNQFDDKATTFARFNYYPPCARPDLVFGFKPHSDGAVMTVLLRHKDVGGLQVLKNGEWVDVPIVPHSLLINLGDGMEMMSNGIFKSPVHRVVTNSENERISLAMFFALDLEKDIEPAEGLIDETRPRLYRKVKNDDYRIAVFEALAQGKRAIDRFKI